MYTQAAAPSSGTDSIDLFHLHFECKRVCVCVCVCARARVRVAQSYLTLCDPMDSSLPGSSVHGIFQARILEWVAISYSRRFS